MAEKRLSMQKEFLELARYLIINGQNLVALDILNEWVLRYPYDAGIDEIYYLLAKLYEDVAEIRDFKKSEDYYTIVVKQYPESKYAQISQERIDYIDRYYIKVR
ncbi:MAG: hypothetical protein EHM28_12210 [Spirochaetaceae bacterium]|nr:MAG: hypothetical protein EHM28_12210 [Spirochaetaceae bacterium]